MKIEVEPLKSMDTSTSEETPGFQSPVQEAKVNKASSQEPAPTGSPFYLDVDGKWKVKVKKDRLIRLGSGGIEIVSPYNATMLPHLRALPGRHYDPLLHIWWVPLTKAAVEAVVDLEIAFDFAVTEDAQKVIEQVLGICEPSKPAVETPKESPWAPMLRTIDEQISSLRQKIEAIKA